MTKTKVHHITPKDGSGMDDLPNATKARKEKHYVSVPSYAMALFRMTDASWLNLNDDQEHDINKNFIGGNLNLSLVCALLFTSFLPLYYSEAQRLNDPSDGLTIDIAEGYLQPLVFSNKFLHDFFDTCYVISTGATAVGTMTSVFYMLAANETYDDAKTFVLVKYLGPIISQLPYYFFTIGICSWFLAVMFHCFIVARTGPGFMTKIIFVWVMILVATLFGFPRMIRGVFLAKYESQKNPPIHVSKEKIANALTDFFADPDADDDFSLRRFLQSLTYITEAGYRPKLQTMSRIQATCMYYEKLAEVTGRSVEEVKQSLEEDL